MKPDTPLFSEGLTSSLSRSSRVAALLPPFWTPPLPLFNPLPSPPSFQHSPSPLFFPALCPASILDPVQHLPPTCLAPFLSVFPTSSLALFTFFCPDHHRSLFPPSPLLVSCPSPPPTCMPPLSLILHLPLTYIAPPLPLSVLLHSLFHLHSPPAHIAPPLTLSLPLASLISCFPSSPSSQPLRFHSFLSSAFLLRFLSTCLYCFRSHQHPLLINLPYPPILPSSGVAS